MAHIYQPTDTEPIPNLQFLPRTHIEIISNSLEHQIEKLESTIFEKI